MKQEIINITIENLQKTAKIDARWTQTNVLDGQITLKVNGNDYTFTVKTEKELRQYQLHQIISIQQKVKDLIIIAENIFPTIKTQLREIGIPYIETNGNLFLKNKQLYCYIDANKKLHLKRKTANRAFTKTGLKVIFHLLVDADLINKKQREIALTTEVALGNIPQVINGLKKTGFLISLNKSRYIWEKRKELLNRWIDGYATELRPKLLEGEYTIQGDWLKINLNKDLSVWGGEPAADLLTNYLRPEKFILYTKENRVNLMKNYRLIPKKNGELKVIKLFWNRVENESIAPPILIYAELMLTGGKRNIETAQLIYDEYIQPNL